MGAIKTSTIKVKKPIGLELNEIKYRETSNPKWKYELIQDVFIAIPRKNKPLGISINSYHSDEWGSKFFIFTFFDEQLYFVAKKGYAWNGATGWPDSKSILRATLVHDALLGENSETIPELRTPKGREYAHKVFYSVLKRDTNKFYAALLYTGVRVLGPMRRNLIKLFWGKR